MFFKFKKLDFLRSYSMFMFVSHLLDGLFDHCRRIRLGKIVRILLTFIIFFVRKVTIRILFGAGMHIGSHDFEFFFEAGFVDFLFFEFFLERNDIVERSKSTMFYIALASISKIEIAIFPKCFFGFCLF